MRNFSNPWPKLSSLASLIGWGWGFVNTAGDRLKNIRVKQLKKSKRNAWQMLFLLGLLATLIGQSGFGTALEAQAAVSGKFTGTIEGAEYIIEVPANWNGTLLLYSHGLVQPGDPNPALDTFFDPTTGGELLSRGYALAGSAFSTTGFAVEQAFHDQINLLNFFDKTIGHPKRVIAWGHSMGGLISAGLVQKYPNRFAGALPMCGVLGGSIGELNLVLDGGFAFKTLLTPQSPLQLVHITNPANNLTQAQQIFIAAIQTPQGRARLALVAALTDTPGWFDPDSAEPDSQDFQTRFNNQISYLQNFTLPFTLGFARADLESKVGGNPSWNVGVNYQQQLNKGANRDVVEAFYKMAGLNLDNDLKTLNQTKRILPDFKAATNLASNISFNGNLEVPVLTVHTTGDGFAPVSSEQTYGKVVQFAGNAKFLRQVYIHRAGHCTFTPAETLAALQTLIKRIDTGKWSDTSPSNLNNQALQLGPAFNGVTLDDGTFIQVAPAYASFEPTPFLRPFTLPKGTGYFNLKMLDQ